MRKVCFFTLPMLTIGAGAEKYFTQLAGELGRRGIQADIVTLDEKSFGRFIRLLNIYYSFNFFGPIKLVSRESEDSIAKNLYPNKWVKASFSDLGAVLKTYDVIYVKNEILELLTLKFHRAHKNSAVIVGVHTPLFYFVAGSLFTKIHNFLYTGLLYKFLLRGFQLIHASNKYTYNFLREKFNLNAKLIYYPFSTTAQQDNAKKFKSNLVFDSSKTQIAFIGRFCEQKGMDTLFRIFEHLATKSYLTQKITINVFGNGEKPLEETVQAFAAKYEWVKYHGFQENKLVPSILSNQVLLISPAKSEVLPFNILEAQSLGVPALAFNIPGPSDIIIDGKTGLLATDEAIFISKLESFILDKPLFNKTEISENIRKRFNPDKIYQELEEMFLEVSK